MVITIMSYSGIRFQKPNKFILINKEAKAFKSTEVITFVAIIETKIY